MRGLYIEGEKNSGPGPWAEGKGGGMGGYPPWFEAPTGGGLGRGFDERVYKRSSQQVSSHVRER